MLAWLTSRGARAGNGSLWALCLAACLLVCSFAARAWALEVPPLEGRVNDQAGVLSADARAQLEQKLAEYEKASGHQFAVLTLKTLQGDVPEDFAIRVAQGWKLGKKGKDDGLLLLVVTEDRKARIEVGYGLEGSITDALSSRVIRNLLAPAFRKGDYAGGIDKAMSALMVAASGGKVDLPAPAADPRGRAPGGILGAILGLLAFGPFLIALLVALRFMGGGGRGRRGGFGGFGGPVIWGSHDWSSGTRGYGGGGFGGGGFGGGGGGGFSGGGGSFGGGGASGSW